MSRALQKRLAETLLASHPKRAARALEALPAEAVAGLLEAEPVRVAGRVLKAMAPHPGANVLQALAPDVAAGLLAQLPLHAAARLVRRLEAERRELVLSALAHRPQRAIRSLVSYSEQVAASLMDPQVLALPEDITAKEARTQVRSSAENARYNVYVVDREARLVGVVNLRELFLAAPSALLESFMTRSLHRLAATADRHAIVQHPGWREVHSLPVVDAERRYLGAVRYRTMRRLEDELRGASDAADVTVDALGDLFSTGTAAVFKALTGGNEDSGRAPR